MVKYVYYSGKRASFSNTSGMFDVAMYTSFEDLTDDVAYLFDNTISGHIIDDVEIDTLIFLNGTTYVASFRDRELGYLRWVRLTKCQYTYTPTSLYTGAFMDYESPSMVYYRKRDSIIESVTKDYPNFYPTSFGYCYITENDSSIELIAYKYAEDDYRLLNPYSGYRAIYSYGNTNKNEASGTPASFYDTINLFMEDPLTKKVIPYYDFKRFRSDNGTANGNILDNNLGIISQGKYYKIEQTYKSIFQTSVSQYGSMLNTAPVNFTSETKYGTIVAIYDRRNNKRYNLDTTAGPYYDGEYRFESGVNEVYSVNNIELKLIKNEAGAEAFTLKDGFEMIFIYV